MPANQPSNSIVDNEQVSIKRGSDKGLSLCPDNAGSHVVADRTPKSTNQGKTLSLYSPLG
jgi:hypothetical protein